MAPPTNKDEMWISSLATLSISFTVMDSCVQDVLRIIFDLLKVYLTLIRNCKKRGYDLFRKVAEFNHATQKSKKMLI